MAGNVILTIRPARDDDEPFLRDLYSQIDSERLALNNLQADTQQIIINHQFTARRDHFDAIDMDHSNCIILTDDVEVGRIIIMQNGQEIRLGDLAILPAYRRRGIATAVIQSMLGESVQSRRPVTLHVEKFSTSGALSLYLRLGFQIIEELDTHLRMKWTPPVSQ